MQTRGFTINQCNSSCPHSGHHLFDQMCKLANRLFLIDERKPFPNWCPLPDQSKTEGEIERLHSKNAAKEDLLREWVRYLNSPPGSRDQSVAERFAKDIESRFFCGEFDSLAWLDARDRRMKLIGAAEWLEREARDGGYYERSCEGMREEAAQLRREAEATKEDNCGRND